MNLITSSSRASTTLPTPVPALTSTLDAAVRRCTEILPGATGCGMNLLTTDGRRITSAATDPVAERLNALHDFHRENPGAGAWLRNTVVSANFPEDSPTWGLWAALAYDLGVRSLLAAPISTGARSLGTILVHSTSSTVHRLTGGDRLATFARAVAVSLDDCLRTGARPRAGSPREAGLAETR
jgi:hypothetical protein